MTRPDAAPKANRQREVTRCRKDSTPCVVSPKYGRLLQSLQEKRGVDVDAVSTASTASTADVESGPSSPSSAAARSPRAPRSASPKRGPKTQATVEVDPQVEVQRAERADAKRRALLEKTQQDVLRRAADKEREREEAIRTEREREIKESEAREVARSQKRFFASLKIASTWGTEQKCEDMPLPLPLPELPLPPPVAVPPTCAPSVSSVAPGKPSRSFADVLSKPPVLPSPTLHVASTGKPSRSFADAVTKPAPAPSPALHAASQQASQQTSAWRTSGHNDAVDPGEPAGPASTQLEIALEATLAAVVDSARQSIEVAKASAVAAEDYVGAQCHQTAKIELDALHAEMLGLLSRLKRLRV